MSDANVLDIGVLETLRTAVFRFGAEAEEAVVEALTAGASVANEVAIREGVARSEVRRWSEIVEETQRALQYCQRQEDADCSQIAATLVKARCELERKVQALRTVQRLREIVEESLQEFAQAARRMRTTLDQHVSVATGKLLAWGNVLSTYAVGSVNSAVSPSTSSRPSVVSSIRASILDRPSPSPSLTPVQWRCAPAEELPTGLRRVEWTQGGMVALVSGSAAVLGQMGDASRLDALLRAVGAEPGALRAVIYDEHESQVSLFSRAAAAATEWRRHLGPVPCEPLPTSLAELFEPSGVASNVVEVPLAEIGLPYDDVRAAAGEAGRGPSDIDGIWRSWEETIAPAVRFGGTRKFLRLIGANYALGYDLFYGNQAIRVTRTASGGYMLQDGRRRVRAARRLRLGTIPVVVQSGG